MIRAGSNIHNVFRINTKRNSEELPSENLESGSNFIDEQFFGNLLQDDNVYPKIDKNETSNEKSPTNSNFEP